jgi:hypothetical protein
MKQYYKLKIWSGGGMVEAGNNNTNIVFGLNTGSNPVLTTEHKFPNLDAKNR